MSWSQSVEAAERLGRMFQDFALVSSKFGEVANLENHLAELHAAVIKHKAEVEKAKGAVKRADEKAAQIIADAQSKADEATAQAEVIAQDIIARARIAADEFAGAAETRHKSASAAAEIAVMRLDGIQGQIADAEIELSKTEGRLKLARDKVAAILKG